MGGEGRHRPAAAHPGLTRGRDLAARFIAIAREAAEEADEAACCNIVARPVPTTLRPPVRRPAPPAPAFSPQFEAMLERVRQGAPIAEKLVLRAPDPDRTLGGVATGLL